MKFIKTFVAVCLTLFIAIATTHAKAPPVYDDVGIHATIIIENYDMIFQVAEMSEADILPATEIEAVTQVNKTEMPVYSAQPVKDERCYNEKETNGLHTIAFNQLPEPVPRR